MQFNRKVHAKNPAITTGTVVLQFPASAGASVPAALETAGINSNSVVGLLISASTGNNVCVRSASAAAGTGVLIPSGQSLYLPVTGWPTDALTYECGAGAVSVMVFLSEFPSIGG